MWEVYASVLLIAQRSRLSKQALECLGGVFVWSAISTLIMLVKLIHMFILELCSFRGFITKYQSLLQGIPMILTFLNFTFDSRLQHASRFFGVC